MTFKCYKVTATSGSTKSYKFTVLYNKSRTCIVISRVTSIIIHRRGTRMKNT